MKKHHVRIIGTPSYYQCAGVFSRRNKDNLVDLIEGTPEEINEYKKNGNPDVLAKTLVLNRRILWGEQHFTAEPILQEVGKPIGPMAGGCFVTSSDSRFKEFTAYGLGLPIPLHDRFETQEQYEALCR